ncbi:MAG: hypothetical protein P8I44_05745, partial [Phycisphaerales bacterium]|nr:hypothetical protein [Phycisphaerales bacterium]
ASIKGAMKRPEVRISNSIMERLRGLEKVAITSPDDLASSFGFVIVPTPRSDAVSKIIPIDLIH